MSFLAPAAFFFAFTIPVVILFYLLKRKRVVKLVPSTLLWQKFLAETQASAPFQKLRRNWLLFLQILLLLLAIFALARPYFAGKAAGNRLRVVILDGSASMQSVDESPSRFEKARKEALQLVDSLQDSDRMMIILAGGRTEPRQSETTEKTLLRRAINGCLATDSPTRLIPALKMAESLVKDQRDAEIHLYSDGALPDLTDFQNRSFPLIYHKIGNRSGNVGIIALDQRANPENPSQRAVYTSIANYSTNTIETEVEFLLDNRLLETRPIKLGPEQVAPQVFIAAQDKDGVFKVRIKAADDLAVDNEATIVSLLPHPVRILLVTRGNRFLEKALRSAPNSQLTVAPDSKDDASGFDLVALDDVTPSVWPKGNVLAIHVANTNWFDKWSSVEGPGIVDWKAAHPILRYVGFDDVPIAESLTVKTPTWAISLVDSAQTSLILAGELDRQRIVWIGFDTLQSLWPYRISFPIFVANAVDWLNPATARHGQLMVHAGDAFRLGLNEPTTDLQVTSPNGTTKSFKVDATAREFVYGETFKQGVYEIKTGTNIMKFCVNLLDAAESNIKPRDELKFGNFAQVKATQRKPANAELWRWIAAAGLFVLLVEWWYYHRRTV